MKIVRIDSKKRIITFIALFVFMLVFTTACGSKEEDYRQIQVYKIDGSAMVARAGNSMDAYENMQLQSGDVVETEANSYVQLKLDEDKYILLEPETKISLQATGNSVDSNTSISLEKGAIVNQLDNPLSDDSNYQVTTPNSTMAVRGTTFRVEITYDEKGESFAKVAVYGGKVECKLVFPDGTIQEPVMIEGGTEVLVKGDSETSEYVSTSATSYEELKEKVLDFLEVAIERGKELSISKEEIEVLKELQQALEEDDAVLEEVFEEELPDEEVEEEITEETVEEQQEVQEEPKEEEQQPVEEPQEEKKEETNSNPESQPQQPPTVTPSNPPASGGGTTSGDTSGGGTTTPTTRNVVIVFKTINGTFATKTVNGTIGNPITIEKPLLQPILDAWWEKPTGIDGEINETDTGWEYIIPEGTGDITLEFNLGAS